jgi:hypothetical protein
MKNGLSCREFAAISKHKEKDLSRIQVFNTGLKDNEAIQLMPLDTFSTVFELFWTKKSKKGAKRLPAIPSYESVEKPSLYSVPKRKDLYRDELDPAMTV